MTARIFLALALVAAFFGLTQLYGNAKHAAALRDAIVAADGQGSDVTGSLTDLGNFVHTHMAANTTVFLAGSYNRADAAYQASLAPSVSGQLYAEAQKACASRADSIVQARCVTDYVQKRLQPVNSQPAPKPDKKTYTHAFISPPFASDSAGLAFMTAAICVVLAVWRASLRPKRYRSYL